MTDWLDDDRPSRPPAGPRCRTVRRLSDDLRELYLAETTVQTHVTRILAKLGLRDRVRAVVLAFEIGIAGQ